MNDRDLTIKRRHASGESSFFAMQNLLFGIGFGALGGVINAFFGVSFFGSFSLYFGQIFVLLCLVFRGINAAIVAVAISALVTSVNASDPYLIIIFALEVFVVHVMLKRGYFLLQSVVIYWICIGIPLLLLLSALTKDASVQVLFINGLTRAINGLMCVSVASIVCWLLPSRYFTDQYNVPPPKLAALIFSLCMLTVTLPALLISLFFIYQSSSQHEISIHQRLSYSASEIDQSINTAINLHAQSLDSLNRFITRGGSAADAQNLLNSLPSNTLNFTHLFTVNQSGTAVAAGIAQTASSSLHRERQYLLSEPAFKKAQSTLLPVVAKIISSTPISSTPIISLMSPIIVDFSYAGMTVGTIAVREIASAVKTQHNASSDFIVTDAQNTVIATSLPFVLPLQRFTYIEQRHPLVRSVLGLRIGDRHYLYHQLSNQYGWQIFTLTSPSEATAEMMGNFYILLLCAGLLLIFFALIANQLSNKITKPLEEIAEHFPDKVLHPKVLEDAKISKEIVTLTQRLINSHSVVNDFQHQLKEQVEHKTRQLKQLNKELYSLAQKDGLTQLLNRAGFNRLAISSYRNCMRNRIKMSLILIDIDHFKLINDTHGHPFGDKCIKHVAKVLQHHCKRDTDIIGRFGGEEFIIMITGGKISEHHERMQLIKDSIAQSVFRQNEKDVLMTVSAGILSISKDFTTDFESMIKLADDQLYISKRTGRNKISILSR